MRQEFPMSSPLTPDQVRQIAHLARLELSDAELAVLAPQLGAIVEYVDLLQQAPTEGVEPLAHALPVDNVFRDDEPAPSLPVDEALANAPARKKVEGQTYYAVPAVLE
jgi:aspartyl-tRNA(Asn)/glutamyl-tRNA(Gln) amidotransferase subunit C